MNSGERNHVETIASTTLETVTLLERMITHQGEVLAQHSVLLEQQGAVLKQHSEMLQGIMETLAQHTVSLERHTIILDQHTALLSQHGSELRRLDERMTDLVCEGVQMKEAQKTFATKAELRWTETRIVIWVIGAFFLTHALPEIMRRI